MSNDFAISGTYYSRQELFSKSKDLGKKKSALSRYCTIRYCQPSWLLKFGANYKTSQVE